MALLDEQKISQTPISSYSTNFSQLYNTHRFNNSLDRKLCVNFYSLSSRIFDDPLSILKVVDFILRNLLINTLVIFLMVLIIILATILLNIVFASFLESTIRSWNRCLVGTLDSHMLSNDMSVYFVSNNHLIAA